MKSSRMRPRRTGALPNPVFGGEVAVDDHRGQVIGRKVGRGIAGP